MTDPADFAEWLADRSVDGIFVVGPAVFGSDHGWRTVVGSRDADGFIAAMLGGDSHRHARAARRVLLRTLARRRPRVVVCAFADEVEMALECQRIWPGTDIDDVVAVMLRERGAGPLGPVVH